MAEDSAARSSLDDLKHLHVVDDSSRPPSAAGQGPAADEPEDLLASLLSETKSETQRELDQIKAQLEQKKQAEADAVRQKEDERRRQLDALREQEAQRREEMMRQRREKEEAKNRPAPVAAAAAPEPIATEPQSSRKNTWIFVAVAFVLAGIAGGGWYISDQKAKKAEAARIAEAQEAERVAKAEAAKAAAAKAEAARVQAEALAAAKAEKEAAEKRAAAAEAKAKEAADRPPVVAPVVAAGPRTIERETDRYDRRFPEMKVTKKRRYKRGGTAAGTKRGGGNKIRTSLDLGRMK